MSGFKMFGAEVIAFERDIHVQVRNEFVSMLFCDLGTCHFIIVGHFTPLNVSRSF